MLVISATVLIYFSVVLIGNKILPHVQFWTYHFSLPLVLAVNFLTQTGVDPGENGTRPAAPLSGNTNSTEWRQINSDFPVGFAVHVRADFDDYSGDLVSLGDGQLQLSLEDTGLFLHNLSVTVPGITSPLFLALPTADPPGSLQSLGVSVQSKLLSIIVDCHIITSVWLADVPQHFEFSTAQALFPPTVVSWI